MTANKPMTGEQLDELMTIAVNMQRDSEKVSDRPAAMFAYAVQVAVLELRKVRNEAAALAAENAGLKAVDVWMNADEVGGSAADKAIENGATPEEATRAGVQAVIESIKTPATDAFLAEVRAQVWIEGNQPAEFGRYWVRYETDVGPQYCSAKWMEHNFCAGSDTNIHKIWLADHSRSINSLRGVTHYTKLPDSLEGAAQ
ncbi:hypothetical protein N8Y44_10480 [Enterobacter hormaechei subsp. xiangfangensis]|nr:hypothetical protein [Enterobacter hormaechei subsp. xiangfangensis]MCU3465725.1 hypothetical protein [Enterobacter hormaechei subsp. xiangfangensis]